MNFSTVFSLLGIAVGLTVLVLFLMCFFINHKHLPLDPRAAFFLGKGADPNEKFSPSSRPMGAQLILGLQRPFAVVLSFLLSHRAPFPPGKLVGDGTRFGEIDLRFLLASPFPVGKGLVFWRTGLLPRALMPGHGKSPPGFRGAAVFGSYIFSGAVTPSRPRQLARTERTLSASFRRAASTAGSSPLMRQAP